MSTRYAEQALDLHPWPAATIDARGHFAFINTAFAHWLHAAPGDPVERTFRDHPHLVDGVRAVLSGKALEPLRALNEQSGVTYRIRLKPITSGSSGLTAVAFYAEPAESQAERDRAERRAVLDYALDQISRIPNSSQDPKVTLDRMVETIVALGVADSAVVYVKHEGRWTIRHAAGLLEDLIGQKVGEHQVRPSLKALRENRVVTINEIGSADRDTRRWLSQCEVSAMMDVNIDVPWGDLVDFAIHYHAPRNRRFIEDDQIFLERVASRITMALNHVSLMDQLKQEQRQLESILENIPVGVFMLDAALALVRANRSFERLFGVDMRKARGKPVSQSIPLPLGNRMHRDSQQAFQSPGPLEFEASLRLPGGDVRLFATRYASLRDEHGQPFGVVAVVADITDTKEAEAERERLLNEVQVERDHLSALLAAIHDEVWFSDTQRRFTLANPAALKEFGLAADAKVDIGKLADSLVVLRPDGSPRPPEDSPTLRALNGEILINEEEIIRTPASGELRYRQVSATPVKDKAGEIVGSVAVVRDITERKRAEAALERMQVLLAEGQKIAHLGSFEYDIATRTTVWSEEEYRIYGLDPARPSPTYDVLLQRHIHPDDAGVLRDTFATAMQSRGVYELEHRVVRPDGSVRWVYNRAHPYYDGQGEHVRYVGITLDVTERRTAEEARGHLAAIVESAQDPIFSTGPDGIIRTWNRGAERLFGYTAREIVGKEVTALLPPERLYERAEIMEQLQQGKSGELLDTVRVTKDGRRINVSLRVTPIFGSDGRVIGASAIMRDISEHKRLEEEIRLANSSLERRVAERTGELSETVAELERFTYTVAHDLRAPLRAIHRYSELLLDASLEIRGAEARDHLGRVTGAAKRMDKLISDLLTYSRVGLTQPKREVVDLGQAVEEAITTLAEQIKERDATVNVAIPVPRVLADQVLLDQVLTNLLSNALKFVPFDRKPKIEIATEARENYVRLWIQDNGIGVEPKYGDRIFGLFERLHGDDKYGGTGIGLAIVQRAAERMDGHVGFESEPGRGSRFWIELKRPGGR